MITKDNSNTNSTDTTANDSPAGQNVLDNWATDGGPSVLKKKSDHPTTSSRNITATVLEALNQQVQHEQSSAHAYQAVSLYFGQLNLRGLESFMAKQAQDERVHADKLIKHITDRSGRVVLAAIPVPRADYESPLEAVEITQTIERITTQMINQLYKLARDEGDLALQVLLHWYITEQVEEEQWADELVAQMRIFHANPGQLYTFDHQWGKRAQTA